MSTPGSTCFRCNTHGLVSTDQTSYSVGRKVLAKSVTRFYCPHCLHSWITDTEYAALTGRFWDRAGLR